MQKGTDDASCQATFEGITRELQNVMAPPPLPIGFRVKGTFCMEIHGYEDEITGLFQLSKRSPRTILCTK